MKRTSFIIVAIFLFATASAQDIIESAKKVKSQVVSSEYDRNSFTYIGIDFAEQFSGQACAKFAEVAVPDKFYDNNVDTRTIVVANMRDSYSVGTGEMKRLSDNQVIKLLNEQKIGQKILAKWFNRQADGSFNVDLLKERGMFNANDADFVIASASKRGESALMDMGMGLIDKSYVLVLDFDQLMTMDQVYDRDKVPAEQRKINGFKASVNACLYKLNFNDSVAAYFFQDYWTSVPNPAKMNAFEAAQFPFIPVQQIRKEVMGTQFNPGHALAPKEQKSTDELLKMLAETALQSTMIDIENKNDAFRVKAFVSGVKPIAAKIGKKEGLLFDQRYFVYENKSRNNGNIISKRRGVVKAMKVVDNRKVTTGDTEPSLFYQIAGGKIDNYGMFMEQKNDVGMNLIAGMTQGGLSGFNTRLEYYIGRPFYKTGTLGKGLTSFKLYVEGGFDNGTFTYKGSDEDFTFMRFSAGLSKDFYLTNFLHWGPFLGYGMEGATWENSADNKIVSDYIEAGARIGVNLSYNIQLIGSANYSMMLSSQEKDSAGTVLDDDVDYSGIFERGDGLGVNIGLRIMF